MAKASDEYHIEELLENLRISNKENMPYDSIDFDVFMANLDNFTLKFFKVFKSNKNENITKYVNILISNNSIDLFKSILETLFKYVFQSDYTSNLNLKIYKSIKIILDFINESINVSSKLTYEICNNNKDLLNFFYKIITEFSRSGLIQKLSQHHIQIINGNMKILYNMLKNGSSETAMIIDKMNFPESIYKLVECVDDKIKLPALMFMGNALYKIQSDNAIFKEKMKIHINCLIDYLDKYLIDEKSGIKICSIIELAQGYEIMSKVDKFKRPLVESGILVVLMKIIDNDSTYDMGNLKKLSLSILWNLAYNQRDNQKDIDRTLSDITNNSLCKSLTNKSLKNEFNSHDNLDIIHANTIFFWKSIRENKSETCIINKSCNNIYKNLNFTLKGFQRTSESVKINANKNVKENEQHFMFSYNHSDKEIVNKIYEALNKNYRLWIDYINFDKKISKFESMAVTVEKSIAVIIFLSPKYKNSKYCQLEAEYAVELGKPLIPIKIKKDYSPRGWLGLIIGSGLYEDFTGKNEFYKSLTKLKERLESQIGNESGYPNLDSWTHQQVKCWFNKIGIQKIKWKKLYDGHDIMFLKQFEGNDFIKQCNEYFKMNDAREIRILFNELQKL